MGWGGRGDNEFYNLSLMISNIKYVSKMGNYKIIKNYKIKVWLILYDEYWY